LRAAVQEIKTGTVSEDSTAGMWLVAQGVSGLACLPTIKAILVAVTKAK